MEKIEFLLIVITALLFGISMILFWILNELTNLRVDKHAPVKEMTLVERYASPHAGGLVKRDDETP